MGDDGGEILAISPVERGGNKSLNREATRYKRWRPVNADAMFSPAVSFFRGSGILRKSVAELYGRTATQPRTGPLRADTHLVNTQKTTYSNISNKYRPIHFARGAYSRGCILTVVGNQISESPYTEDQIAEKSTYAQIIAIIAAPEKSC